MLLNHHQYVPIYCHAYEILKCYDPDDDVSIHLQVAPGHDHCQYNLPTADEVAVILPGVEEDNMQLSQCDIILQNCAGGLQIITTCILPMPPCTMSFFFPMVKMDGTLH
jgi:hypothetical protein